MGWKATRYAALLISVAMSAVPAASADGSAVAESTTADTDSTDETRNPSWAKPLQRKGLPNLHETAPGIYRGAQPTPEGFASLKAMGVKTVINFRRLHSDKDEIRKAGLEGAFNYREIPMNAWDMTDARAAEFLRIVEDERNLPVFYHCQHGADRTGTMTAVYRIAHQGWPRKAALDEMVNGGFGYHAVWTNLIKYIESFDPSRARTEAAKPDAR